MILRHRKLCFGGRRLLCLLIALLTAAAFAHAEESEDRAFGPGTRLDGAAWRALIAHDEAFSDDARYEPVMLLASHDDMESWLVKSRTGSADGPGPENAPPDGYFVMVVQLVPAPKIIGAFPVGTPPEEISPACEIKLLFDSDSVLDGNHMLTESIRERFKIKEKAQTIEVIYLDTADRDYLNAGWVNRIRVKEGKSKYTITYKMRYPVRDGGIDAALAAARADGFSLYDAQFPAEIDWGCSHMTLSFAADVDAAAEDIPGGGLPERDAAARMIADCMPSEEENWGTPGWGTGLIDAIQITQPIRYTRFTGTVGEQKIRIEVWPVPVGDETR